LKTEIKDSKDAALESLQLDLNRNVPTVIIVSSVSNVSQKIAIE
jgi:hypothetical protein